MKKVMSMLAIILVTTMISSLMEGCTKDGESQSPLSIVSVVTDQGIALNNAVMATDIPRDAAVNVVFNKDINPATANSTSVIMMADGSPVPTNITVNGATVTVHPQTAMAAGTLQNLSVSSVLRANDGSVSPDYSTGFMTDGRAIVVPPQAINQLSYFAFDGSMEDEMGTHTPAAADVRDLTYAADRFGFPAQAGDFNGSTTIVEIPNGNLYMAQNNLTVSVWIKANATKDGHFVMGLGAWKGFYLELTTDWASVKFPTQYALGGGGSDYEDNLFLGTGETNMNTGWQGWTYHMDVLPHNGGVGTTFFRDKWAHVVCTYDAASKLATMFVNGIKVKQHDFNLWPMGDPKRDVTGVTFAGNLTGGGNNLALGFIQGSQNRVITDAWADPSDMFSNHFKGLMDDVRIFKVALSETEVATLYAAEKP